MFASGCKRGAETPESALAELEVSVAEGAHVEAQLGHAPFAARVLSWNALGARVPGADLALQVDGEPVSLEFDAHGLASVSLSDPGLYTLSSEVTSAAQVAVVERPFDGFNLSQVLPEDEVVDAAWSGEGAVAFLRGGRLWWWIRDRWPEPVLEVGSDPVRGVRVAQMDGDDRQDVVVWTAERLFVLRGAPDGGLAWATGFEIGADRAIGGVAVGDATGDGHPDLLVGVEGGEAPAVEVLAGSELLRFELEERHEVLYAPSSIAFGEDRDSGRQFLELVSAQGDYARYERAVGEELEMVEDGAPVELAAGTELLSGGDFNGDGLEDSFLVAPRAAGAPRKIVYVDYGASPLRFTERAPSGAQVTLADGDDDGMVDLWTLDDGGNLRVLTSASGTQVEWNLGDLSTAGPFAVAELDGRDEVDVVASGVDRWVVWPGTRGSEAPWRVRPDDLDNLLEGVKVVAPLMNLEDPAGTVRWVGIQERQGEHWLKSWRRDPSATSVVELSRERVAEVGVTWVDAAICGTWAWVLVGDTLSQFDLSGAPELVLERTGSAGTAVACREDGWGAVLGEGEVIMVRAGVEDVRTPVTGLVDIGLGVGEPPELLSCAAEGCGVVQWEVGGEALVVIGGRDSAEIVSDAGLLAPFPGRPVVVEADGDGSPDLLLVGPDGTLTLMRSTPDGPAFAEVWWVERPLAGPAFLADADGDGVEELFAVSSDGVLFVTSPSP